MKLKKVVAAGLSVLLLQTLMEPSMQFVAFGMDESVAIDNDGISSDIMEADDENLKQHRIISTYKQNHPAKC